MRRCCLALLFFLAAGAQAAPLPNAQRIVRIDARDQPIEQFLQDMMSVVDVPVNVTAGVQGLVNGSFNAPAERLLRDLARAYNLTTYFDGAVLHVSPAADSVTRSFAMPAAMAQQVLRSAGDLGLTDARNSLRSTRDGTLVAVGARRFVQQVDELVRQVRPAGSTGGVAWTQPLLDYRVFYLRYAWAQDVTVSFGGRQTVVPGVASILRSVFGLGGRAAGGDSTARPTQPRLRGQGLRAQGGGLGTLGSDARAGAGMDALMTALATPGTGGAQPAGFEPPPSDGDVAAGLPPSFTRIEADPRLNAVIVRDLPERLPRYGELIASLDVEPQALEIEATIIDLNTDRLRELGINWRWSDGPSSLMFGNGSASDLRLQGRQDPTPQARGGTISAVIGNSSFFAARISALQAEGAAKIVSSPQVVTLSNVEAVFDNSSTFYVRVAGRDEVDLFNVTAGTTLRVTPHVFKEQEATRIKLLVQVEDGSITPQLVDTLPVVERSAINTQALIAEGESLLIGGMVRDSQRNGVDKVPGLGDLPIVGNLFKTRSQSQARVERLFLISPRLASTRSAQALQQRLRTESDPPPAPAPAAQPAPGPRVTDEY